MSQRLLSDFNGLSNRAPVPTGYSSSPALEISDRVPAQLSFSQDLAHIAPVHGYGLRPLFSIIKCLRRFPPEVPFSLSLPPNLQPSREKLVLAERQANERTGLLVAALYDGRLTHGQFAAERVKTADQMASAPACTRRG